ncbi:hypothetical protein BDF14DRAFT_263349 [Spinellus fusiger]|nr:hypothetical protein BDF14DRAFT_263349 [Spinellus fusiger]
MDPGHALLQHIKTIPNLIKEDPSTVTLKNSSFLDTPWSELSKHLSQGVSTSSVHTEVNTAQITQDDSAEEVQLGNWDSMTGYQDAHHKPTL